jgi:hypothetical protein
MNNGDVPTQGEAFAETGAPQPADLQPAAAELPPASPPDPFAKYPEDLRAPWTWLDLVIFFFFALGSALVTAQVVFVFAGAYGLIRPVEGDAATATRQAIAIIVHQMLFSAVLMGYLWLLVRVRFKTPFWRTVGFRTLRMGNLSAAGTALLFTCVGMVLAVAVNILSVLVRPERQLPVERLFQARESVLLMMFAGIVVAPLVEETLFRGWLYPVLARTFGVGGAILVAGGLFGLMHGSQLGMSWGLIGLLSIVGIVLTWVRARTGSVAPSYFLHLGYNSLIFIAFFIGTGGLRNLPGSQ